MTTTLQLVTLEPKTKADASVVWLHGLGADGHDFEPIVGELGLPSDHSVRFIFPHAPIRPISINAGMEMRAWYDIKQQGLDREVDEVGIRESAATVATLIDREIESGIDSERIILAGFSQGGAIAFHLGLRYMSRLAGIMALSTYLPLEPSVLGEAHSEQREIPIFIAHGEHDPLVPVAMGNRSAQFLGELGYDVEYKTYPIQHAVSATEISDIATWLKRRILVVKK